MDIDVVMISGKQGSGKSTITAKLRLLCQRRTKTWAASEVIFAGPIYEVHNYRRDLFRKYGLKMDEKDGPFLQDLGTKHGRERLGENVWVKIAENKIFQEIEKLHKDGFQRASFFISDTRFPNELNLASEWKNSIKVRLEAPEVVRKQRCPAWRDRTDHPSEVSLDGCHELFDMVIDTHRFDADQAADQIFQRLLTYSDTKMV